MIGAYAQVGAKLVERGYSAIPILPGSKRPGFNGRGLDDWERFSVRLPTEIEVDHWSASDAGVGIAAGGPHHVVSIDIDVDDRAILAAIFDVLPPTPVRKIGQKGETLLFRGKGVPCRSYNQYVAGVRGRRLVDIIANGRQTVLPPSRHPDTGAPYRWSGEAALENTSPEDLPELPSDIGERLAVALAPYGYQPDPVRSPIVRRDDDAPPHRALNDAALDDLDAWVPKLGLYKLKRSAAGYRAVATWRPSHRGRPMEQRQPNLKIHRSGIRDFHDADRTYTPIDLCIAALDVDLDEAFALLSEWLGRAPVLVDLAISEPVSAVAAPRSEPDPEPDVTHPPGLLGEMTDWIVATARRPNRLLALGAAITVLGTLVGRRIAGPTRSGTHLYVLGLAPTGAGKDHPLTQVTRLMKAAKAGHHIGPDEMISMPATINLILRAPLCLCPMDEFGAFLKRINNRKASGFEQGITKVLRSAWGKSFSTLHTPEWAGRTARAIESPALSIYGVSTPDEFYGSLEGGDVVNGVLNRFLVLKTAERVQDRDPELDPGVVPEWLADALEQVYTGGNPLLSSRLNDISLEAAADVLDWADEAAKGVYVSLLDEIECTIDRTPTVAPFLARTAEMAARLATIRAVGLSMRSRLVGADDMAWGRDVALLSAKAMAGDAADFIAENEHQAMAQRVIRIVKSAGGRITQRELHRRMQHVMRPGDLRALLESLTKGSERLVETMTQPVGGGRPMKWLSIQAD